ncbi:hypothetical protein BDC45DRAFT_542359 [Circinella umbellata]|nr:hypothetical protein BDC45DRAFT_542359 [Circinella umbellata]
MRILLLFNNGKKCLHEFSDFKESVVKDDRYAMLLLLQITRQRSVNLYTSFEKYPNTSPKVICSQTQITKIIENFVNNHFEYEREQMDIIWQHFWSGRSHGFNVYWQKDIPGIKSSPVYYATLHNLCKTEDSKVNNVPVRWFFVVVLDDVVLDDDALNYGNSNDDELDNINDD